MAENPRATGRIVALDIGEVRTGVAVSDATRTISRPLEVVPTGELEGFLRDLVREESVAEIVVGVPRTLQGEVGFQARRVLDKLNALKDALPGVRIVPWDERFSTRLAVVRSRSGGRKKGAGRRVDHLAAAGMLQEYLDLEARGNV